MYCTFKVFQYYTFGKSLGCPLFQISAEPDVLDGKGLQNQLNILDNRYKELQLNVNTSKTKVSVKVARSRRTCL